MRTQSEPPRGDESGPRETQNVIRKPDRPADLQLDIGPSLLKEYRKGFDVSSSDEKAILEFQRRWEAGAALLTEMTDAHANALYFQQFEPVSKAIAAGEPVKLPDSFWSREDLKDDFTHRRQAVKTGLQAVITAAMPTMVRILKGYADHILSKAAALEKTERKATEAWRMEFGPSLELRRLQILARWIKDRTAALPAPNWSASPRSILNGIVDFN